MTFFIKHFLKSILTLFVATALLSPSLLAKEMTQEERNEMAAKLIPIITMLLMSDDTPPDTTKPDKPKVSIPAPTEVQEVNVDIGVSGEVGSFIYVNDVKVGVIGADGTATITLDLHDGDNLFFLTLVDAAGNKSDTVDFTVNGAAVIHADRKVFIFPGDSERVVVDANVTLAFEGDTLSWVTIDDNAIVVAPTSSEEPMQKKTVKLAISRDGNVTGETVSFDILIMKKIILLEGDLGVEGGTLYNEWQDISIHFDENILEQEHHFEMSAGLNELGIMIISSKTEPLLSDDEELYFKLNMPSDAVIYDNYFNDSEIIARLKKRLNVVEDTAENYKNKRLSKLYNSPSSNKKKITYPVATWSKKSITSCLATKTPLSLDGFEFDFIWQGNTAIYGLKRLFGGKTRLQKEKSTGDAERRCSSRLWSTKSFYASPISKNEEPVLLVHGFIDSGKLGSMDDGKVYFKNFAKVLKSTNKYVPFEFEWRTNARFQDVAKELKKAIELIGNKTKKQVHIVAHSFGGVLSRTLIQNTDNKEFSEKYIASLTTVGSPYSGIKNGGYTSSGLYTYYNNGNKNVTIGNSTSIDFPHGQDGVLGENMGTCRAITCYQMGINDYHYSLKTGYGAYGTFKEFGYIPYKLASSINNYPKVPTQVLLGLNPSKIYLNTPEIGSGLYQMVYEFGSEDSPGDDLISLQGQRAYPLIDSKYNENNIEEHILNFYLDDYGDFKNNGIGIYDDMLGVFESIDDHESTTSLGEYDFTVSTFYKLFSRRIKLTDNHIFTENDSILNFYTKGATHRTSGSKTINLSSFKIRLNSEVGLQDCETSFGCKNPTWQYFRQFAEKNKAKAIPDPKTIAVTGDVKVIRSGQISAKYVKSKAVEAPVAPKIIVEVYKADRDILDFIMNLVDTGERTVLRDDGTYELNVTYAPDTNYTVIAYVEGDEDARIDEHIRAAQSIFLETHETLESSTLHFPTITLVDANYEEGSLLVKVIDSASGDFLSDFNVSVVLNGTEVNEVDINVSTGAEFNVTKAKGDYTVNVYKNGYHDTQAQCTVVADVTTECIVSVSASVEKSITGRWIYHYGNGNNLRVDGGIIRIMKDTTSYTQVQVLPNNGCSIDYDRPLSDPVYGAHADEFGYMFSLSNDKLLVSFVTPGGGIGREYSNKLTLSDEQIKDICPEFVSTITHNGTTYNTVTSPYTGKVWLDRNLGASQVCTAYNDTACYGDYYQWGRNFDGHQSSDSSTTSTQATDVNAAGSSFINRESKYPYDWTISDNLGTTRSVNWSKIDGSSVCPVGFRLPTLLELKAETIDNNVVDIETAFSNFLRLPAAGIRGDDSIIRLKSLQGTIWTINSYNSISMAAVGFGDFQPGWHGAGFTGFHRSQGSSMRCLKD